MEPCWSSFLFHQTSDTLQQHNQVIATSLLPILSNGTEAPDQKPVLPICLDQKAHCATELLKAVGRENEQESGECLSIAVVKKEPKSKTPFSCGYCHKTFRDSYHLRRHESCHTGIKMVSRPKKTPISPTMVPLLGTSSQETSGIPHYITTVAGIMTTASTLTGSTNMIPMHHQEQQKIPKKPPKLVKKNHACEMCGKAFRDVYHLNRHKLSHSDEKPFECPICHQRFKRKDRMAYHVRSHDGGVHKPYICSVCGKGFSRPDHLSCHVKHVHSSERPFKCQVTACTSAFATKDRLRSHMIRHEGKVTCNICGKMLSAAYITSHLKTHGQASFSNPCNKGELTVGEVLNNSFQVLIDNSHKDTNGEGNSSSAPVMTTAVNLSSISNPVTIAAQLNFSTNTVNITPVSLQHPVTFTSHMDLPSVTIPTSAHMSIPHHVAIASMPVNITSPLNISMRPIEGMSFLSQVLPSSQRW